MECEFRVPDHAAYIEAILEGFIRCAELQYRCGAAVKPHLGWKLVTEPPGRERFQLPDETEELGEGDCEDLVIAWAAYLRATGEDSTASARILQVGPGEVHCMLLRDRGRRIVDVYTLHSQAQIRMGGFFSGLKNIARKAGGAIKSGVSAVGRGAEHAVSSVVHGAGDAVSAVGRGVEGAASSVYHGAGDVLTAAGRVPGDIIRGAGGVVRDIGAGVKSLASSAGSALGDVVEGAAGLATDIVEAPTRFAADLVGNVVGDVQAALAPGDGDGDPNVQPGVDPGMFGGEGGDPFGGGDPFAGVDTGPTYGYGWDDDDNMEGGDDGEE